MRYTTLIFAILLMGCSIVIANTASGQNITETNISFGISDSNLESALKQIEKSTAFRFAYKSADIQNHIHVTLPKVNRTVAATLDLLLTPRNLIYQKKDNYILIFNKPAPVKTAVANVAAKGVEITGSVSDSTGTLPGVSIKVKYKESVGTTTDLNGKYILDVPDENAVLIYTMVGYAVQEIPVKGRHVINVVLKPLKNQLADVEVVVAYGKQKKESVIGSITTINPSELKVPSSNLTTALAGRLAGVISYQRSGEPGADNAEFFIRGATTFGYKKDPLILIDGMEYTTTELARLNVDDIATFSIMKDATANAIYGARGANGVILVTTKEGKEGKAKISVRFENSLSEPTRDLKLADPITYMRLNNEAILTRNPLAPELYSQQKIDNTISGVNPGMYPAVNWKDALFSKQTYNQRLNFNLGGGGQIATYYIASALNQDNGNLKVDPRNNFNTNINMKTYSLRSNVNIKITKSTTALVRLFGTFDEYTGPIGGGSAFYLEMLKTNPVLFQPYYQSDALHTGVNHILFGNSDKGQYLNPYADMVKGYQTSSSSLMGAQYEVNQDLSGIITQGLSIRGMVNTNRRANFSVSRNYTPFYVSPTNYDKITNSYILNDINPDTGTDYLGYNPGTPTVSSTFHGEAATNYNRTFNKHAVTGLLLFTMQSSANGNSPTLLQSLPSRNVTLGGRVTYAYNNRYFTEFNFGYNGSERFSASHRFGFFPSIGAAWYVSNEKFWEPLKSVIDKFKLRGNYGLVGNDAIGSSTDRFFYLSNVNMNDAAYASAFGTDATYTRNGISVARYDNNEITWETARNSTFGLEMTLFGKMDITAEYFIEHRSNILMPRASIPASMGLEGSPPQANVGKSKSNSVDISLTYNSHIGKDISFNILGNFTYAHNLFSAYEEPQYKYAYSYHVGHPINQKWGYIAERLFVDDEEVRSSPTQNFGTAPTRAGDIKFRDVNGDGVINIDDQVPIGFPTSPEIVYGFGFSSSYKSFDFSAFFQGSARSSFWIDPTATAPFTSYRENSTDFPGATLSNQLLQVYADDHWSESNRNLYALWPRLSPDAANNVNNAQSSTWFMRNGAFLRLKQVEVGYTLPKTISQRIKMSSLRMYVNGTNLATLSGFDLWDIEMGGNGLKYPNQRVINFGVQAGF
ncbi:MAG: TonB-dependent receptor [Mucilaginibacter sp.]|uniref:TonB-dependent receptor n=1 Tax=Mucilaginibacter sp. TaxID=1882438 RepID=UPI003265806F